MQIIRIRVEGHAGTSKPLAQGAHQTGASRQAGEFRRAIDLTTRPVWLLQDRQNITTPGIASAAPPSNLYFVCARRCRHGRPLVVHLRGVSVLERYLLLLRLLGEVLHVVRAL